MFFYHTVEDRNNPDHIEQETPFLCSHQGAWLGKGYYLWEQFIENAHWWGTQAYKKNGAYVIVQFEGDSPQEGRCFDLLGNMEHLSEFRDAHKYLKDKNLQTKPITVSKVIEFIRKNTDFDNRYDSIRAKDNSPKNKDVVGFQENKYPYMELLPHIQLCLFSKSSLNLSKGKIVYPEHYRQATDKTREYL